MNFDDYLDKEEARKLKEEGMERAVNHADDVLFAWREQAKAFLFDFTEALNGNSFRAEEVILAAHLGDNPKIPDPPDRRAWGAIFNKAHRDGLLEKVGVVNSEKPSSHRAYSTLWRRIK